MAQLDHVILVKLNHKNKAVKALRKEYGGRGFPMFVLTDAKGGEVAKWTGYKKEKFLKSLDKAVKAFKKQAS